MMKTLIGALVGGTLIFMWQFLSWGPGEFHYAAQQHTPKQDTILQLLEQHLEGKEGGYMIPRSPKGVSQEEMEKQMENANGKPWAMVSYHKAMDTSMGMNMARGLAVNILVAWLVIWVLGKYSSNNFSTTLLTCLIVGIIIFLNEPYTTFIWFKNYDIRASLLDAVASWGLCGLWLGWWLNRK
jgi:hypothetical protein